MQQQQKLRRRDDTIQNVRLRPLFVLLLLLEVLVQAQSTAAFQPSPAQAHHHLNLFHLTFYPRKSHRSKLRHLYLQQKLQQPPASSYTAPQLWASSGQRPGANRDDDAAEADDNSDNSSVSAITAEDSEVQVGSDADMGGFANYLIPYALTAIASLVATGLLVKFVLLDF